MNSLQQAPLSGILASLFAQADRDADILQARLASLPATAQAALQHGDGDYHALYSQVADLPLAVSRQTGTLLYALARATGARTIVEFGTSFGVSTLHLAAALRDNGGGRLIGSEFAPEKVRRARETLAAAGFADLVDIRAGDALETLASGLPPRVDLLLLDGAKGLYPRILDLVEPHLWSGALVIADNADWCPDYLARVRDPAGGYVSLPFGEDVELSVRLTPAQAPWG